jgi:purine-binding chemotaxis protein CheW
MGAAVQLLVFMLDQRQFGLPLTRVERVVRAVDVTPLPRAPAMVAGVVDLQGTLVPVISMRRCLEMPDRPLDVDDQFVISRTIKRSVALIVDHVKDIVTCPAEAMVPAKEILPRWKTVQGVIQLETGLALVEDLDSLLSLEEDQMLEQALREQHGN